MIFQMQDKTKFTQILMKYSSDPEANPSLLFPYIYEELKRIAHQRIEKEYYETTLTKTGLVHETFLKMVDQTSLNVHDRDHFLAIASNCMRQILVDHARKNSAEKRGANKNHTTFVDEYMLTHQKATDILELDEKLHELKQLNERMAKIVELRFFGELPIASIARTLDVSERTVKRDWKKARGWLYMKLKA